MVEPNRSSEVLLMLPPELLTALVQSITEHASSLGLVWRLRPAEVSSKLNDGGTIITYDGDTVPIRAVPLIENVFPGQHVMVMFVPPAGNYIIGALTFFHTTEDRFVLNGTWEKPPGTLTVVAETQGGGGAGGGAQATAAGQAAVGGGGEGGAYARMRLDAVDLANSVAVTVGQGGNGVSASAGNAGDPSSFGTDVDADGGTFGNILIASSAVLSQSGGASTQNMTGTIQIAGGEGGASRRDPGSSHGGQGGGSFLGNGGGSPAENFVGRDGNGYGAGGSGACNGASDTAKRGGHGADGIVIVTSYGFF